MAHRVSVTNFCFKTITSSGNFMQVTNANHIFNVKLCATLNKQKEICELNALIKNIKILFPHEIWKYFHMKIFIFSIWKYQWAILHSKSLKPSVYFIFTSYFNSDQSHFKCSLATKSLWLPHRIVQPSNTKDGVFDNCELVYLNSIYCVLAIENTE